MSFHGVARRAAVLALMCTPVLAWGCGSDNGSGNATNGSSAKKVRILFVQPFLGDESYQREKAGAVAEAKKHPEAEVSYVSGTDRTTSASDVIAKIQTGVTKGTDVIAIDAGAVFNEVKPTLADAISKGVKVVEVGTPLDLDGTTAAVVFDHREAARPAGEYMKEALHGTGEIGVIRCVDGNPVTDAREQGFMDGIAGSDIKVVARGDAKCDPEKARGIAENMLTAHPNLKGIFSDTDVAGAGVWDALRAQHRKDIVFIGHDGQIAALKEIAAGGYLDATVRLAYEAFGSLGISTAVKVAEGKPVPKDVHMPQYPLITKDKAATVLSQVEALVKATS